MDYDADHDGDQDSDEQIWIPLWEPGLLGPCIILAAIAAGAWILTQFLTT